MALKEKKAGLSKRTAKNRDADSILHRLERLDVSNVFTLLKAYLEPIRNLEDSAGKENALNTERHRIAKQYVPFLSQTIKLCSNGLSTLPVMDDEEVKMKAQELSSSMSLALDCFENLRDWLVGCSFEIELQRSYLVRRLMAWKKFGEALTQNLRIIRSLCHRLFTEEKAEISPEIEGLKRKDDKLTIPPPERCKELTQGLVILVTGAATDLIICTAEIGAQDLSLLVSVSAITNQLEPWLSKLEAEKLEKQRCLLFKGLHKCLMAITSGHSQDQPQLIETYCFLTLHQGALSSMRDSCWKVVRSVCSQLSSQGPDNIKIAIDVAEKALARITHTEQNG